jgi:membrane-associated protease RseP (regulator of RpoE activity)
VEQFPQLFSAWRTLQLGSREVIDALVAVEHRGPSPELQALFDHWRGAHYWSDRANGHLVLVRPLAPDHPVRWGLYVLLFVLTVICSLAAGAALAGVWYPITYPGFLAGSLRAIGQFFVGFAGGDWKLFLVGWAFALPVLGILSVHELGHYLAAKRYAIDTAPPLFIPVPPPLGSPIGTFGAFIRLRSPVLDRQQLTDVGAAGPLAGFVVALAVLVWGYLTSERVPFEPGLTKSYVVFAGQTLFLGDSLLTRALRDWLLPGDSAVHLSLPAFAGWVGCFLTGLNLLPLSQFDGGHVLYGLLGKRQGVVAFVTIIGLLYLANYSFNWYIWVALALLVGGGKWTHPPVAIPNRAIPASRAWVGLACVVVFVATFVPIPFAQ